MATPHLLAVVNDAFILIPVLIGFPLFGAAVFFWWRWQYGVWSVRRTAGTQPADPRQVVIVDRAQVEQPADTTPSATADAPPTRPDQTRSAAGR
jgi:hypothetical protein